MTRPALLRASLVVCALVLSGCAEGGAAAANAPGVMPGNTNPAASAGTTLKLPHAVRRTMDATTCTHNGPYSFDGVPAESNISGGSYSFVGAGQSNQACQNLSAISGGGGNLISGGSGVIYGSFIGAGDSNFIDGSVSIDSGIVAGTGSSILASYGLIGGGQANTLTGEYGFIGAGENNTVSGEGAYIAAGGYNTASGEGAVIDGGFNSSAAGNFATIPGGYVNSAAGTYSFAAGARASAPYSGDFVWSDGSAGDAMLTATKAYQFLARASGGFTLYTNAGSTVGAQLAAGSGTWASLSDRNAKTDIVPLDDAAVLAKVDALPISRWSYKSEHGVRHVGPMAQDFYTAFKVGEDDRHITSIDEDGVALAAVKALHADNRALHADNGRLRVENARLRGRVAALETLERRRDQRVSSEFATLRAEVESLRAR